MKSFRHRRWLPRHPMARVGGFKFHDLRMKKKIVIVARRLAALATAQYVLVTVLVGCAAVTIAHEASAAINTALLSLLAALKRL